LDRQMRHDVEVVIDRLGMKADLRPRLAEAVELALRMGQGNLIVAEEAATVSGDPRRTEQASGGRQSPDMNDEDDEERERSGDREKESAQETAKGSSRKKRQAAREGDILFSASYACTHCGLSFEPPSPLLF